MALGPAREEIGVIAEEEAEDVAVERVGLLGRLAPG
jgi:hypothetical protein